MRPRVYWRMTDNSLELTVRLPDYEHGVRDLKGAVTRDILCRPQRRADRDCLRHL